MGPEDGVTYIFFSGMSATGWSGVSWSTETNPLAAPSDPEARAVSMAVGTAHQRARQTPRGARQHGPFPCVLAVPGSTHAEYRERQFKNYPSKLMKSKTITHNQLSNFLALEKAV